ncbi:MAG TPA: alpha/beta fold hydrolase [Patescibacteria group bacterium]|nr:alpha/beta fold hydrolase [Patescibacteria group bacterium]
MRKRTLVISIIVVCIFGGTITYNRFFKSIPKEINEQNLGGLTNEPNSLSIEYMRKQEYPGSDIVIEQTLPPGSNYNRYIASYKSDGLKIYALLTIPQGEQPETGWPVIVFNHGYIQPEQYRTTEKYVAYIDAFSRNGYLVFKPDFRGHGNSEGKPEGAYYSSAYTVDVLNAVSSMKKYKDADPERIGMWGHSMGGMIVLRSMVVTEDIKAGEIWAGVVASYEDLAINWHHPVHNPQPWVPSQREQAERRPGRQELIDKYGNFEENPQFWQSISPISFVKDISGPIQLQHGTADDEVPLLFSQRLDEALRNAGKPVELYTYEGDNHNLSNNLDTALQRSVDFFDKALKD